MSGHVQLMFDNLPTLLQFIMLGKLRPLAVTSAERADVVPELPVVADFVPGYEAGAWYGLVAPTGTRGEIVEALNRKVNPIPAQPDIKSALADLGYCRVSPVILAVSSPRAPQKLTTRHVG